MEAKTTAESASKPIPPTPLKWGDEGINSTQAENTELLKVFKLKLKAQMLNASFHSRNLNGNDYDRYFRDTWFVGIHKGIVLVDGEDPIQAADGLLKYQRRLKAISREVFGREAEFRMAAIREREDG